MSTIVAGFAKFPKTRDFRERQLNEAFLSPMFPALP